MWEAEMKASQFEASLGKLVRPHLKNRLDELECSYNLR
jgi:hypothetical protein